MKIEILKELLKNSTDKKKDILEYVDVYDKSMFNNYKLIENDEKIYLNDKCILIKKSTLNIESIGKIIKTKNKNITICKRGTKSCITYDINDYYLFISKNTNKHDDRYFYEQLIKIL